ncbi:hypothetical protein [Nocardiopsis rhodophaea]
MPGKRLTVEEREEFAIRTERRAAEADTAARLGRGRTMIWR